MLNEFIGVTVYFDVSNYVMLSISLRDFYVL